MYFAVTPLMVLAGALLMRHVSDDLSRVHRDVRLYDIVTLHEADPQETLSVDLEAFYGQGRTIEDLTQKYNDVQADFLFYSTVAGAFIGLVIGLSLIGFSMKRTRKLYEIDHAACVDCGRCFSYCPQNKVESENSSKST